MVACAPSASYANPAAYMVISATLHIVASVRASCLRLRRVAVGHSRLARPGFRHVSYSPHTTRSLRIHGCTSARGTCSMLEIA
eukprot:4104779-Prymnesium_polylepis.2